MWESIGKPNKLDGRDLLFALLVVLRSTTLSLALRFPQPMAEAQREERIAYISGVLDTWDDDVALCRKNLKNHGVPM